MRAWFIALFLGFTAFSTSSRANVPALMNFQGTLTDSAGAPLEEVSVSVVFAIWDEATGGDLKWTETQSVATDASGRFNVLLGSVNPLLDSVFNKPARWLSLQVESDPEMAPRTRIASVGYADRISTVDGADGGTIYGDVNLEDDLTVKGRLGVGTTTPSYSVETETAVNNYSYVQTDGSIFLGTYLNSFYNSGMIGTISNHPFQIYTSNAGPVLTLTAGGQASGRVGIGTATPGYSVETRTALNQYSYVHSDGAITLGTYLSSGQLAGQIGTLSNHPFQIFTSNAGPVLTVTAGGSASGRVGIGTTAPSYPLHVRTASSAAAWFENVANTGLGVGAYAYAYGSGGSTHYGLYAYATGATVNYGIYNAAGTKNWANPHPQDPAKSIVYVTLEGGENGAYHRGSGTLVDGKAIIELPAHFQLATSPDHYTNVTVTPNSAQSRGLAVVERSHARFSVAELFEGKGNYTFDYLVIGVRRGYETWEPITDVLDYVPFHGNLANMDESRTSTQEWYDAQPEGLKKMFVSNGILNADGSVNRDTFNERGWRIVERPFPSISAQNTAVAGSGP